MTKRFRQRLPKVKLGYRREVVKIQRPLFSNDVKQALIYNADKSIVTTVPWTTDIAMVFGADSKQYWIADLPKREGYVRLVKQIKEQDW